jgi:hypothetical protein
MHVPLRFTKGVESIVAAFAIEFRSPMTMSVHVLESRFLCPELCSAGFTFPVTNGVHVLLRCVPIHESSITYLAVDHCECEMDVKCRFSTESFCLKLIRMRIGRVKIDL